MLEAGMHSQIVAADRLKRSHFEQALVWEFLSESEAENDTDEGHVRASHASHVTGRSFGQFLAAATFSLTNGTQLPGAVRIDRLGKQIRFTPAFVFMLDRQLEPVSTETDRLLSRFTKTPGSRAKAWRLDVTLPGERRPRSGNVRRSLLYLVVSFVVGVAMRRLAR